MPYEFLATLVVVLHLAFIVFAVLGGLLSLRWRGCSIVHIPSVVWAALIEFMHWPCPLTPLEQWLRQAAGQAVYTGGFWERYLAPVIYPPGLTQAHQVALGIALVALNVGIYRVLWRRSARMRA